MDHLRLGPTVQAQWQALIQEAEQAYGAPLSEELENYLVLLLQHYANQPDIIRSILALEFLESQHKSRNKQKHELRAVGDKCLIFSGLFPDMASRKRVQISYFVELGQEAYALLAENKGISFHELFHALEINFVALMDILQVMRELAGKECSISPLQAEELWRNTGSRHARAVLRRSTKGLIIRGSDFDSLN